MKTYARLIPASDRYVWNVEDEILSMSDATVIPVDSRMKRITSTVWDETERIMNDLTEIVSNRINLDLSLDETELHEDVRVYLETEGFPDVTEDLVKRFCSVAVEVMEYGMKYAAAVRALEAYTSPSGLKWDFARITGSVQGEEAMIYFPKGYLSETERNEIVAAVSALYFNTGEMVCVWCGEDRPEDPAEIAGDNGQYDYIPIPFASHDEVKKWIADYYEDGDPENVVLYVPDRPVTRWTYEIA